MTSDTLVLEQLLTHVRNTHLLASAQSVLEWDERTGLPPEAAEYRTQQVTLLAGLIHTQQTSPTLGEWLTQLIASPLATDRHSPLGASLHRLHKDYQRQCKLPMSFVEAITRATMLGQQAWAKARQTNDYLSFRPHLAEIFRLRREEAALLRENNQSLYDVLLDQYEDNADSQQIANVFAELQTPLSQLVQKLAHSPHQPKTELLHQPYSIPIQQRFSHWVAQQIGFSFDRGRLDETDHPFCTTLGPHDHRILTRYHESQFQSGFYGTLHEAGHGLYEQGLPTEWFGFAAGHAASLGVHESQSRLWENMVGRSLPFWTWCFPHLAQHFPSNLANASPDLFFQAVNHVQPSLIRVEADEATYNLHIMIRFELEKELIDGNLPVEDLPTAWNERYQRFLGITPPTDSDGVLQDIHWSAGLVGYFPTYTLGNLYAAQLIEKASRDLGPLDPQFAQGNFAPLLSWLRSKVHQHGHCFPPTQLMHTATGTPLSCQPLLHYLTSKLEQVYQL